MGGLMWVTGVDVSTDRGSLRSPARSAPGGLR
jgi:hypothetical protein